MRHIVASLVAAGFIYLMGMSSCSSGPHGCPAQIPQSFSRGDGRADCILGEVGSPGDQYTCDYATACGDTARCTCETSNRQWVCAAFHEQPCAPCTQTGAALQQCLVEHAHLTTPPPR
jgi:hypothetical protein